MTEKRNGVYYPDFGRKDSSAEPKDATNEQPAEVVPIAQVKHKSLFEQVPPEDPPPNIA